MTCWTSEGFCVEEWTVSCVEFARERDRRLRLEVEVILPAVDPHPFENVLGLGEAAFDVAARDAAHAAR